MDKLPSILTFLTLLPAACLAAMLILHIIGLWSLLSLADSIRQLHQARDTEEKQALAELSRLVEESAGMMPKPQTNYKPSTIDWRPGQGFSAFQKALAEQQRQQQLQDARRQESERHNAIDQLIRTNTRREQAAT